MAEVRLTNVTKLYGGVRAVADVTLTVADEEFVVLVGPSGCGKSTTLRMIAGLEEITSGTVEIGDRVVNRLAPRDRDVAMVFQNYALYQHMNVYDNLAFGLRNRKVPRPQIEAEVKRAASILGISELLGRRPRQLSGGQQQRVALGRCIVRNPRVFLFDEPLSNLDAKLRAQMRVELKRLRKRVPTTSIFVTHDQVEAMTLGDRVVVMKEGLVQQVGSPLELYNAPANRFVAGFIGGPAMNFVTVEVRERDGTLHLEAPGLRIRLPAARKNGLAGLRGRTAVLGIRPEHLLLAGPAGDQAAALEADVEVIEQLGSEMLLDVRVGDAPLTVARVPPELGIRVGERIRLTAVPERLHVFDPATEQSVH
jgi:multiple sugar transport system ATP-binding protein